MKDPDPALPEVLCVLDGLETRVGGAFTADSTRTMIRLKVILAIGASYCAIPFISLHPDRTMSLGLTNPENHASSDILTE
jgi:hypothetical protein